MRVKVDIPSRVCLMGDKVDLLGKPVIGMAVNLMMHISYEERNDNIVEFYSQNINERIKFKLGESAPRNINLSYWSTLYERLKGKIKKGFIIEVNSEIPIGVGLSSSAALSVGFIRVLKKALNLKLTDEDIAELAYLGENHDLGIQCGRLDQYTIAFGGVVFIYTGEKPRVEYLDIKDLPIVVGDSMEKRKASLILNRIKQQIKEKNSNILNAFKIIEECVYEARKALIRGDFNKLGQLMDKHQEQEKIFKADTKKILNLCKAAKNAGALGAKQMGAGGGGCMLAIAPGRQKEVAEAIENTGGKAWIFDIYNY